MVDSTWFFGTTQKMMTLRLPDTGMGRKKVAYAEDLRFENGGADSYRPSSGSHLEYEVDYGLYEASGSQGLDNYADFAQGLYGYGTNGPVVYFADPMYYDVNLFSANWAAPMFAEYGARPISTISTPTFANTGANTTNQPYRMATYDLTSAPVNAFLNSAGNNIMIIPIPPGMTLWLGLTGAATGTGLFRVESWMNGSSTAAASTNLTPIAVASTTLLNASIASTAANYVRMGLTSSAAGAGSMTIASLVAQLWPTGITPMLTGNFQSGQGNNGCKFTSDAVAEKYILRDNQGRNVHYKGLSFGLVEVYR